MVGSCTETPKRLYQGSTVFAFRYFMQWVNISAAKSNLRLKQKCSNAEITRDHWLSVWVKNLALFSLHNIEADSVNAEN